jgi:hypothetical protein
MRLTKRLKQEDARFQPVHEFEELNKQRSFFRAFVSNQSRGIDRVLDVFVHRGGEGPFSNTDSYFPKSYELMWSYVEGPHAVNQYHDELKADIHKTYAKVIKNVESFHDKAGFECSSYRLSNEMQDFVQAIRRLAYMEGGFRRALTLALFLGKLTYSQQTSVFGGYNYRPIDILSDGLIAELLKLSKQECPSFDGSNIISDMDSQIQYLDRRNIYTYMPRSFKLLSSWAVGAKAKEKEEKAQFMALCPEGQAAQALYDKIKQKITTSARNTFRQLENLLYLSRRPALKVCWMSNAMKAFLPEIEQLSKMDGGLVAAMELLLFLGKHSFSTLPGLGPMYACGKVPYSTSKFVYGEVGKQAYERPSDAPADEMLVLLLTLAKKTGIWNEAFNLEQELSSLKAQQDYLVDFGVDGYFPKSYSLMSSFLEG